MTATSLLGMAEILELAVGRMPAMEAAAMERAAQVVEVEAKRVIGTYDYGWPALAEPTVARKGADTPLLETGELRDSIEHNSDSHEAYVGSNNMKAVWHELGTSRGIPPRPFLSGALEHKADEVVEIIGHGVVGALENKGGPNGAGHIRIPISLE